MGAHYLPSPPAGGGTWQTRRAGQSLPFVLICVHDIRLRVMLNHHAITPRGARPCFHLRENIPEPEWPSWEFPPGSHPEEELPLQHGSNARSFSSCKLTRHNNNYAKSCKVSTSWFYMLVPGRTNTFPRTAPQCLELIWGRRHARPASVLGIQEGRGTARGTVAPGGGGGGPSWRRGSPGCCGPEGSGLRECWAGTENWNTGQDFPCTRPLQQLTDIEALTSFLKLHCLPAGVLVQIAGGKDTFPSARVWAGTAHSASGVCNRVRLSHACSSWTGSSFASVSVPISVLCSEFLFFSGYAAVWCWVRHDSLPEGV